MKKIGKSNENEKVLNQDVDETLSSLAPNVFDSALSDNEVATEDTDKGPFFQEHDTDPTMTLNPPEVSQGRGMTPANFVKPRGEDSFKDTREVGNPDKKDKNTNTKNPDIKVLEKVVKTINDKNVRPALEIDIENLDESHILEIPEIRAASFEVLRLLDPKPKDKTIRFRWANYKNHVAGNLARYLSIGFQMASLEDIDTEKTPIDSSMIDGTQIKYYDVVLLKIPVLRLMALYKANILRSVNRLVKAKDRGLSEASRDFTSLISSDGKLIRAYNKAKEATGGRDPVEFYTPGIEELVGK